MPVLRRAIDFYRTQIQLLWLWSGGPVGVSSRAVLIFLSSLAAFTLTTRAVPGIVVRDPFAAGAAALLLALASTLARPVLVAVLSGFSVVLVAMGTLLVQAVALVTMAAFSVGLSVDGPRTALLASLVYALTHTLLAAGLSIANDESFFGTLVRQLAVRHRGEREVGESGVVFIQIDGLSHPLLMRQLERGVMPTLARWLASGELVLDAWRPLLPTQTSASQAGILHGNNDGIPAFRWWDKETQRLFVSNHPPDAREIMRRVSDGRGLLVGGTSIGNLFSGDAKRSYLTAGTFDAPVREARRSHVLDWFVLSPYAFLRWFALSIGEVIKEVVQAQGERFGKVQPRGVRAFPYPFARAATNVVLRHLETALVIEEMYRGAPAIYVDFVDYDEIAHHAGVDRVEARQALAGIDRIIAIIEKASLGAPRRYRFVVLSDHGQSPGPTFRQRYGMALQTVIAGHVGEGVAVQPVDARPGHAGGILTLLLELPSWIAMVLRPRTSRPGTPSHGGTPDLVVAASGNLAHVAFPSVAGRATREMVDARYPGLIDALVHHPGVGLVLARTASGSLAIGASGTTSLDDGRAAGTDPVAPYGPNALDSLRRIDAMPNCGDLVVMSCFDAASGEVAAFEEQIGSHGGLGGWQGEAFIVHPKEWTLAAGIVGAPQLHQELRRWVASTLRGEGSEQ